MKKCENSNDGNLVLGFCGLNKLLPIIICVICILASILMFTFGPLDWQVSNATKLYSFLFLALLMLIGGYLLALMRINRNKSNECELTFDLDRIILICGIVFVFVYFPTCYTLTGKWYPDIYHGLTESGEAYRMTKYLNENSNQMVLYIRFLLSPFLILISPITLYFYPIISIRSRFIGLSSLILTWFLGLSQGVNKNTADLAIQLGLICLFILFSMNSRSSQRVKSIVSLLLIITVFLFSYRTLMHNRVKEDIQSSVGGKNHSVTSQANEIEEKESSYSTQKSIVAWKTNSARNKINDDYSDEVLDQTVEYATFGVATIKKDHLFFKLFPDSMEPQGLLLAGYLTHGYKGLSLALDQTFTSSYGLGFSDFIRHNVLRVLGLGRQEKAVFARTYMAKLEKQGWPAGKVWATFFVYPASDISFAGTLGFMFLIGFLFALAWRDALLHKNPFAVTVFANLCILLLYLPANNQLFLGGESTIGIVATLLLWWLSRTKVCRPFFRKVLGASAK